MYVFYSLGKICMTLLWIGWCFSFISSILQISLSPQDGYAQGAEDSGDTISLHAVAMALVLRAYLYCICNFHFQQVEAPVLYPEQQVFECSVCFLGFHNLFTDQGYISSSSVVCEYMIHLNHVCFDWVLCFVVAGPKFLEHQPFFWQPSSFGDLTCVAWLY
jgi:hypothetical protein